MFNVQPAFPYHGSCYPSACTTRDIEISNVEFARRYNSIIASSPNLPDSTANFIQAIGFPSVLTEMNQMAAVGCTDDQTYSEEWKGENYAMVTILSVIGFLVLIGTAVEGVEKQSSASSLPSKNEKESIGFKLLKSFSLISNMEFIFKVGNQKGSGRLDCLEGMRAISMTWVILGHNFLFGASFLHSRNNEYIDGESEELDDKNKK